MTDLAALEAAVRRAARADRRSRLALRDAPDPAHHAARILTTDRRNIALVHNVLEAVAWPLTPPWRRSSVHAFWLLVQHCPDNDTQQRALAALRAAHAQGSAHGYHLAHLEDRVLVRAGLPQVYGTQLLIQDSAVQLLPLEDKASVDFRRRVAGLPPLRVYLRGIRRCLPG